MAYASMAQTTLFFDDLENGSSKWVLNDIYTGYPGYIADTPPQPAGVGTHTITYTYTDENECTNEATASKTFKVFIK